MFDGLSFGWRTAILAVAAAQLLAIAIGLTRVLANRVANRTLSTLLIVLTGILLPWLIGFAGFYDRWRWLTFAPFQITLAAGPLIWLYANALVTGRWPEKGWRHLAPAAVQAAFLTASFLLPLPVKQRWSDIVHQPYSIVADLATIAGLAWYGIAGLRLLRRYRALLAGQRSDDTRFAARWLSRAIGATLVLLPVWTGYALWDAIAPIGYVGLMGLYVAIAAFGLYLAIEGWRHAALPFPHLDDLAIAEPAPPPRDWGRLGELWAAKVAAERWHCDPDLSLGVLARRLGTNTNHLSRAVNEGLGVNFSSFIGRMRAETVAAALRDGSSADLLDLALEAGFSSKASFNRAFLATFGQTPSAYRRHVAKDE
ncbi:helix-turn-helix domain-containing protein [uncultured Sphingomonas sp.]|uniref:AraC family transcriptional regulator n=1 Tax=uncultured Sphingomonas sp. TaxID=158754 RepID=UPI0025D73027|nr:helix-turn-helix domain-containing protein [uncultured Sphingomonas sp.]